MIKKKIINILIGASIVLLLSNVVLDIFVKKQDHKSSSEVYIAQIDSIFISVLERFELNEEWIEKRIIKNVKTDSLTHVFNIKIPNDIPIASILKEMNYGFYNQPAEIVSEEKVNYGKTVLKIFSNSKLKLQANFNVEKNIQREYAKLAFILTDSDELNEEEFEQLMRIPYPYSLLLLPNEKSFSMLAKIYEFRKEVFLLINDDVDEKKYSLDVDYEKLRLKNSILSIISDFPKVLNYLIDTESDLYKSTSYNFVKDEFNKRNVKIVEYSKFVNLNRDTKDEIITLIKFYIDSGKSKEANIFLISAENFIELERTLAIMFNKGTKYYYPSSVN